MYVDSAAPLGPFWSENQKVRILAVFVIRNVNDRSRLFRGGSGKVSLMMLVSTLCMFEYMTSNRGNSQISEF